MTPEQKAAFVFSQSICALIEAFSMMSENLNRAHRGESMAHDDQEFMPLARKYGIDHNSVVGFFRE